jgi:hypothetical protein
MKKLILIIALCAPTFANAQNAIPNPPVFSIGSKLTWVDSFTQFVASAISDYHLIAMDSTIYKKETDNGKSFGWSFIYTDNSYTVGIQNTIKVLYYFKSVEGQPDLNIPYKYGIDRIEISGNFLSLAKIYNKMFNTNIEPKQLQMQKPHGPIFNGYWYNLDNNMGGWNILIAKR